MPDNKLDLSMPEIKKYPSCVICNSQYMSAINEALAEGLTNAKIFEKYESLFENDGLDLTTRAIKLHNDHLNDALNFIIGANLEKVKPDLPKMVNPNSRGNPMSMQEKKAFRKLVDKKIDEVVIMEELVRSGLEDLDRINDEDDGSVGSVFTRDRIRKSVIEATSESAKVKKVLVDVRQETSKIEKARLVYRMFELFAKSLRNAPVEFRAPVAIQLKDLIRKDDELYTLLKDGEAEENRVLGAGEVEVVDE